jgi:hypothetical protein
MSQFKGDVPNVEIGTVLQGAQPVTTANYGPFFIADRVYEIVQASEVHTAAGTGGACTLQIEKLTGTQAPGAGTTVLVASFNLVGTANTVQTQSGSNKIINAGDRLSLKLTGTPTSVANLNVDVVLRPV